MNKKHIFDILDPHDRMRLESARGLGQLIMIGKTVREGGNRVPTVREYNKAIIARKLLGQPIRERKEFANYDGY